MTTYQRLTNAWLDQAFPRSLEVLYHAVTLAPRLILHVASVAALAGFFAACVPAARYEEAKSASEVELAGRRRAEAELVSVRGQLDGARAELNQRAQKLAETEQFVSESKLEQTVAVKERDEATGLVDQLRGELARVGDNLRSYATQKAELEKTLRAAEIRQRELEHNEAQTVAIARLTRDLSAALASRIASGELLLDVHDGRVVLSSSSSAWFNDDGTLRTEMDLVLSTLGRVLSNHTESRVELKLPPQSNDSRGALLLSALAAKGVPSSRLKIAEPPLTPVTAGGDSAVLVRPSTQLELSFSAG